MGRKCQSRPIVTGGSLLKISAMKRNTLAAFCACSLLALNVCAAGPAPQTDSGIALDAPWKVAVFEFAKSNLQHSAWGVAHCERDFQLAQSLAAEEKLTVIYRLCSPPRCFTIWAFLRLTRWKAWITPNAPRKSLVTC